MDWGAVNELALEWNRLANVEASGLFGRSDDRGSSFAFRKAKLGDVLIGRNSPRLNQQQAVAWIARRIDEFLFYLRREHMTADHVAYCFGLVEAFDRKMARRQWITRLGLAGPMWEVLAPPICLLLRSWLSLYVVGQAPIGGAEEAIAVLKWARGIASSQERILARMDRATARA